MSKRIERAEREGSRDNDAERGRGRGAFLQYYDDLGFSSTPEAHAQWKEEESAYQKMRSQELSSISEYESQINKYREEIERNRAQIEAAKKKIPTVKGATEKAWAMHKSRDLKPVTTVGKWKSEDTGERIQWALPTNMYEKQNPGKTLVREGGGDDGPVTYAIHKRVPIPIETLYLHPQQIQSLYADKKMKEVLKPVELEEYKDLGTLVNTSYRSRMFQPGQGKETKEQILHSLNMAQEDYYNKYIAAVGAKNREEIGKANSIIAKSMGEVSSREGELAGAMASIEAAKNKVATIDSFRQKQMNDLRNEYDNKINTMKEIFGG